MKKMLWLYFKNQSHHIAYHGVLRNGIVCGIICQKLLLKTQSIQFHKTYARPSAVSKSYKPLKFSIVSFNLWCNYLLGIVKPWLFTNLAIRQKDLIARKYLLLSALDKGRQILPRRRGLLYGNNRLSTLADLYIHAVNIWLHSGAAIWDVIDPDPIKE